MANIYLTSSTHIFIPRNDITHIKQHTVHGGVQEKWLSEASIQQREMQSVSSCIRHALQLLLHVGCIAVVSKITQDVSYRNKKKKLGLNQIYSSMQTFHWDQLKFVHLLTDDVQGTIHNLLVKMLCVSPSGPLVSDLKTGPFSGECYGYYNSRLYLKPAQPHLILIRWLFMFRLHWCHHFTSAQHYQINYFYL